MFKMKMWRIILLGLSLLGIPAVSSAQFAFATNADNTITITGYTGSNGVVRVPSTIDGLPVIRIGEWAFYAANVTNVLIPDSVTNIGDGAFFDCQSLTNITVGNTVVSIANWAFAMCPNLLTICCRGNAPELGGTNVFEGSLATIYYLPGSTNWGPTLNGCPTLLWNPDNPFSFSIEDNAITITFYNESSATVTIPGTIDFLPVNTIGRYAFNYCTSLTNITIGSSIANIEPDAFSHCTSLTTITVDSNNPSYLSEGGIVFDASQSRLIQFPAGIGGCYTIPNSVTNIETDAFADGGLAEVTLGSGFTRVGDYWFANSGLTNIVIGSSITNIGTNAFTYSTRLAAITVNSNNPSYYGFNGVLFDESQATLIQFPEGLGGNYAIPNTVTHIGDYAFYNCGGLTEVVISGSVANIGRHAFDSSYNLATVRFGAGVTNIEADAFYYCRSLTNVIIGSGVINIGADAFNYCYGLTHVTIPNSVINIGSNAFFDCSALVNVSLGTGITSIGDSAFSLCVNLTGITIPNNVTNIGNSAFADCMVLTSITIPKGVVQIGDFAFFGCYGLTNLIIDNSAVSIADNAFIYCVSLTGIYFRSDAPIPTGYVFDSGYLFTYVTVYYLPGTVGWGPTFGGLVTKPWLLPYPLILNNEATFGVKSNQFNFVISWATNLAVVVEACINLSSPNWQPVQTNALTTGSAYFSDPQWTNYPGRFYRLRSP